MESFKQNVSEISMTKNAVIEMLSLYAQACAEYMWMVNCYNSPIKARTKAIVFHDRILNKWKDVIDNV